MILLFWDASSAIPLCKDGRVHIKYVPVCPDCRPHAMAIHMAICHAMGVKGDLGAPNFFWSRDYRQSPGWCAKRSDLNLHHDPRSWNVTWLFPTGDSLNTFQDIPFIFFFGGELFELPAWPRKRTRAQQICAEHIAIASADHAQMWHGRGTMGRELCS